MNEKISEKLLNVTEAAQFLGVSTTTIWRLLGRGTGTQKKIGCYRVGRRVLFSREEHLHPYLEGNKERGSIN